MSFNKKMSLKKAVLINAISKYSGIIINLLFSVILARLLSPEDYGIVAVVTVFTNFFSIFADMGFGTAVIQNKELSDEDTNSIYTFTIYLGIVLGILFIFFSYPMSIFYGNKVYFSIGCLLAISLTFNTFNMIPNAVIMKKKKFTLAAFRTIVIALVGGVGNVILAFLDFKYYAIVITSVFSSILIYFWNIKSEKLTFLGKVNWKSIRKILSFSVSQFAFNFVNYFSRNLDNLLTGKFMGSAMLGYYDKAYKLMQYPTSNLTHVITPVLHPILSEYQNDKQYIYDQYMKIVKLLAVLGIYISAVCYLSASEIILILYGESWKLAIPCFMWLSISVWTQVITASAGAIFQSLGDTKRLFFVGSFNAVLNVIAILIGIWKNNIVSLSLCIGICYILHFITSYYVLIKFSFKKSYFHFLKNLGKEFFLGILLIIGILLYPFEIENILLSLVVKVVFLGVIYLIGLMITGEGKMLYGLFKKKL